MRVRRPGAEAAPVSHADAIVTRLLEGYDLFWRPFRPRLEAVSPYTDQLAEHGLSRPYAARHQDEARLFSLRGSHHTGRLAIIFGES